MSVHNEFPNRCMVCLQGVYDARIKLRGSPGYSGVLALSHYPSTPNTDTWSHTYSIFTVAINELPKINHTGSCRLHLQPILPLALLMPQFFFFKWKMSPFSSSHWHLQVFEVLLLFVTLWAYELIVLWVTEAIILSVAQLISDLAPETPLTGSRIFLTCLLDLWALPGLSLLSLTERHL